MQLGQKSIQVAVGVARVSGEGPMTFLPLCSMMACQQSTNQIVMDSCQWVQRCDKGYSSSAGRILCSWSIGYPSTVSQSQLFLPSVLLPGAVPKNVLTGLYSQHLGGRGRWISEFQASLVCRVSSRTARATQRNPVSKNQKEKKKKKKKMLHRLGCRPIGGKCFSQLRSPLSK